MKQDHFMRHFIQTPLCDGPLQNTPLSCSIHGRLMQSILIFWTEITTYSNRVWWRGLVSKGTPISSQFPSCFPFKLCMEVFFSYPERIFVHIWNFLRHSRNKLCDILRGTIAKTKIFVSTLFPVFPWFSDTLFIFYINIDFSSTSLSHALWAYETN